MDMMDCQACELQSDPAMQIENENVRAEVRISDAIRSDEVITWLVLDLYWVFLETIHSE